MVRYSNSWKVALPLGRLLNVVAREGGSLGSVFALVSFYLVRLLMILFIFYWFNGYILLLISRKTFLLTSFSCLFRKKVDDYMTGPSLIYIDSSKICN